MCLFFLTSLLFVLVFVFTLRLVHCFVGHILLNFLQLPIVPPWFMVQVINSMNKDQPGSGECQTTATINSNSNSNNSALVSGRLAKHCSTLISLPGFARIQIK